MPWCLELSTDDPERLAWAVVELGALDVELEADHLRALLPDQVGAELVGVALGLSASRIAGMRCSPALPRDDASTWVLRLPERRVGPVVLAAPGREGPNVVTLRDGAAFGTGLHATTRLCLDGMLEIYGSETAFPAMLDVGTGSGVLALVALALGAPSAVGVEIDPAALAEARQNAVDNRAGGRLHLVAGRPEQVTGVFGLVVANLVPGPILAMAATLPQRLAPGGRLLLSGLTPSVSAEVVRVYRHQGLRLWRQEDRSGWVLLVFDASW